jgi:hypothetical protein
MSTPRVCNLVSNTILKKQELELWGDIYDSRIEVRNVQDESEACYTF